MYWPHTPTITRLQEKNYVTRAVTDYCKNLLLKRFEGIPVKTAVALS